jgi:hypothetical protein
MNSSHSLQQPPAQPGWTPLFEDNTALEESRSKAREELKARGYPKQDLDPATGERFSVYPIEVLEDSEHPLYGQVSDSARPENWRELEVLKGRPGMWLNGGQPTTPSPTS